MKPAKPKKLEPPSHQAPEPYAVPDPYAVLNRIVAEGKKFRESIEVKCAGLTKPCDEHKFQRQIDLRKTVSASFEAEGKAFTPVYAPCPDCKLIKDAADVDFWMRRAGVPDDLLTATLDNWTPRSQKDHLALVDVREFAARKGGFLVMIGGFGLGKGHLSVGVMRVKGCGLFVTQRLLMTKIRQAYGTNTVEDVLAKYQRAKFLVLDEIGLSTGGRDELPMVHDILDYRHNAKLGTILNGNCLDPNGKPSVDEFTTVIGDRMADRLRQSTFKMLILEGESWRKAKRPGYMESTDKLPG